LGRKAAYANERMVLKKGDDFSKPKGVSTGEKRPGIWLSTAYGSGKARSGLKVVKGQWPGAKPES